MADSFALADREAWATGQFSTAALGDRRRTRRLVKLATQMAGHSHGSIPQQTGGGADMKAAYRLFDAEGVTQEAVCQPHFQATRRAAGDLPLVFLLQDTTVLNFTSHHRCEGLGPIGRGQGLRGLHQQNVLAVNPSTRRPLGLLYQQHHRRTLRPPESRACRRQRQTVPLAERESYWWIAAIKAVGSPPPGVRWVHVGDRGEDLFGVYDQARTQGTDWLIRVSQNRRIATPQGPDRLLTYARGLPSRRRSTVPVHRRPGRGAEEVCLEVSGGAVTLLPSRGEADYASREPVACWVVRVWESSPPAGVAPLEWVLCTSLACATEEALGRAAQGYGLRWIIEEFHKCLKTGCQAEQRRLEHTDRLEPLLGLLSVLAVWLLQLKYVARDQPQTPAGEVFEESTVQVMARYLGRPAAALTIDAFWRGLGRLGGHPGRKGDGPLGWLRAWRGWQIFQWMLLGAQLSSNGTPEKCG